MNYIVVSFIGPDRPGLVDKLSNLIKQHQGNWQTSSLHHLSGFFAGVIEIAIDDTHSDNLLNALKDIENLEVTAKQSSIHSSEDQAAIVLELTANDRAGIVQEISSVIHHQGGNLVKLVSTQDSAPHSGQVMFKAKAQITVNEEQVDQVISALENIADDLMVDISK